MIDETKLKVNTAYMVRADTGELYEVEAYIWATIGEPVPKVNVSDIIKRLTAGEWVTKKEFMEIGVTFSECFHNPNLQFSRTAEWCRPPLNGQKVTCKFRLKSVAKETPKKPVFHGAMGMEIDDSRFCPECGEFLLGEQNENYCRNCGQHLDIEL